MGGRMNDIEGNLYVFYFIDFDDLMIYNYNELSLQNRFFISLSI
jgi:hypothetical protein